MSYKIKPVQPRPVSPAEHVVLEVNNILNDQLKIIQVVFEDYLADDGLVTEVTAAIEVIRDEINVFEPDESDDHTIEKLKAIIDDCGDVIQEKILPLFDKDDLLDFLGHDYAYIKIENLAQREKLEAFVQTEIYPFYNDQNDNFLL
jgi:hypothetical protein